MKFENLCCFISLKTKFCYTHVMFSYFFPVWISSTQLYLNSASPSTMFPTWLSGSTHSHRGSTSPRTWRSDLQSKETQSTCLSSFVYHLSSFTISSVYRNVFLLFTTIFNFKDYQRACKRAFPWALRMLVYVCGEVRCVWVSIVTPSVSRSIVGMTMYNQATQEIAKPSELLTSVRAYMTVLQSIENYVTSLGCSTMFSCSRRSTWTATGSRPSPVCTQTGMSAQVPTMSSETLWLKQKHIR